MQYVSVLIILSSLFLYPTIVYSQKDNFSLALKIIEDFGTEEDELLANLEQNVKDIDKGRLRDKVLSSKKEKANATAELKNLRWLESEPSRLAKRVFNIVNAYTNKQIEGIKELSYKLPQEEQKEIAKIVERTSYLRDSYLKKLADAQGEEKAFRERIYIQEKPVHGIDVPQIEEPHRDRGIWER